MKVLILMALSCLMFSAWVDCQVADLRGLIDLKKRSLGGLVGGLEGGLKKRSTEDNAAINLHLLDALKKREARWGWHVPTKRDAQGEHDWMTYSIPYKREAQRDWMEENPWMG
jgi:hypothetical protein